MSSLNQDKPSPEITEEQIIEFESRILFPLATKLGSNPEWSEVIAQLQSSTKDHTEQLTFEAGWDEYAEKLIYTINIEQIFEFDELWDEDAIRKYIDTDAEEYYRLTETDEATQEASFADERRTANADIGYYGDETSYLFSVSYDCKTANGHKSSYVNLYDDERNAVDTEIVHYWNILSESTSLNEFYKLLNDGEPILDSETSEKMLSVITLHDIGIIMNALKKFSLLDTKQKALKQVKSDNDILITNGTGANMVAVSSYLLLNNVTPMVVVDDDSAGKEAKKKIIKIGDSFTNRTFTIRDLDRNITAGGTIEDALPKDFVESKTKEVLKKPQPKRHYYA